MIFRSCNAVLSSLPILKYTINHLQAKGRRFDCNFVTIPKEIEGHPTSQRLDSPWMPRKQCNIAD